MLDVRLLLLTADKKLHTLLFCPKHKKKKMLWENVQLGGDISMRRNISFPPMRLIQKNSYVPQLFFTEVPQWDPSNYATAKNMSH